MVEAIRLCKEEDYSVKRAALLINNRKKSQVPRTTLSDRLRGENPRTKPALGRPTELSAKAEAALVKCLQMCAEFNYPMRKKDLQNLVQVPLPILYRYL